MKEERKEVEIFPLCRAKVCQDEEIDSRFALSWLLITKIIPLPFPFFFSSSFSHYIPRSSRSNALKLETILFEIVLPPRYLYGGRGIGRHEGPESWVFRLDDCCRCWEEKLLRDNGAISRGDPQLFHWAEGNCEGEEEEGEGRRNDPRELTRNWTRNDGAFLSFLLWFCALERRGEREREWKVRADYSPRNSGESGEGKYVVRLLCRYHESYQGIINMLEYARCHGGSALFKHLLIESNISVRRDRLPRKYIEISSIVSRRRARN